MRRWWVVAVTGVLLMMAGGLELQRTQVQSLLAARLEYELREARERGHPARVLATDGGDEQVRREARELAHATGATVLAISPETALVIPSPADRRFGTEQAWSTAAYDVASAFLRNDDFNGAAAAVVRRYTDELVLRGVISPLPPRAPIFLPDIERHPDYPSESWLLGLGIVLFMFGAERLLADWRTRAHRGLPGGSGSPIGNAAPRR